LSFVFHVQITILKPYALCPTASLPL
jgi:hypothetical protein